jgi:colicin import membrane protein
MGFLMKKIIRIMLMAVAVAGCAPKTAKEPRINSLSDSAAYKESGMVSESDIYGQQASGIEKALDAALNKPHAFYGKTCNVSMILDIDGSLQRFSVNSGDKEYCHALLAAARQAKFPAFTDRNVYEAMGASKWNMHGQP